MPDRCSHLLCLKAVRASFLYEECGPAERHTPEDKLCTNGSMSSGDAGAKTFLISHRFANLKSRSGQNVLKGSKFPLQSFSRVP